MPHVMLDTRDPATREDQIRQAAEIARQGRVVVLPTDTVYGIGCDAFDVVAVAMVLAAKHRGRDMPPPVLVASEQTVSGLARDIPTYASILMRRFWPGGLTLVLRAQPSLTWDLGETNGTVAVRMPDDQVALDLVRAVGPMAVTSANISGQPAATTAQQALEQLGASVSVYLDDGERSANTTSTIIDCTGEAPVVLRHGAIALADLQAVVGELTVYESVAAYHRAIFAGPVVLGPVRPSGITDLSHASRILPAPGSPTTGTAGADHGSPSGAGSG